jgi:hypothetical protein
METPHIVHRTATSPPVRTAFVALRKSLKRIAKLSVGRMFESLRSRTSDPGQFCGTPHVDSDPHSLNKRFDLRRRRTRTDLDGNS